MVEDSAEDAEVIQYALTKAGFRFNARIVRKRLDFIRSLKDFSPDIILSDFSMPAFDGMSALKTAKRKMPHVPFVFVSGTIGEERAIEAVKIGATDYILKDNLSTMVPKIKRALKEAKERLERINAKKALEKIARQLAEAQEVAHIGCWERDLTNDTLYWSKEIFNILGRNSEITKPNFDLLYCQLLEEEGARVKAIRDESYKKFKNFSFYTRIRRHDDKTIRWIYVKAKFKLNKGGSGDQVFGTLQDVTDLKETEIKLEETNAELKTFIYKASHDLRGPISSALGLCNIAREETADIVQNRVYLNMINDRMHQLDSAINSLIETMKIKDQDLDVMRIDFDSIISSILHQIKYVEGASNVNFCIEVEEFEFYSYPSILTTILQNIIENSIKYRSAENPSICIKVKRNAGEILIEVSDNGVGIPGGIKERIFDMFFRGHRKSKGTGLGLYIVKNAVRRLDGAIAVDSVFGEGTTFSITLPLKPKTS